MVYCEDSFGNLIETKKQKRGQVLFAMFEWKPGTGELCIALDRQITRRYVLCKRTQP